jgi:pimeloyl-ACP methyl ester carboxylesterase
LSRKVIIGVHGLNNKPEAAILEESWRTSIAEGLARHGGAGKAKVRFQLVYWADLMYGEPLDQGALLEPYVAAEGSGPLPRAGLSVRRVTAARVRGGLGRALQKASRVRVGERVVSGTVKAKMPDLHLYRNDEQMQRAVQDRLVKRLRSARRWRRRVMLIAHSMGSIVAYDVLSNAGRALKGLEISHFVTVGSPLGLAGLKTVVEGSPCVPECVARWSNFSDPKDPVASWDTSLSDNYQANSRGVTVSDHLVVNGYVSPAGKSNPHKVFGYLRTPEISELIAGFVR